MRALIGHIDITIETTGAVFVNALSYPAFRPDHTEEHLNFDLLLATHARELQAMLRRDPEDLGITASARRLLEYDQERERQATELQHKAMRTSQDMQTLHAVNTMLDMLNEKRSALHIAGLTCAENTEALGIVETAIIALSEIRAGLQLQT